MSARCIPPFSTGPTPTVMFHVPFKLHSGPAGAGGAGGGGAIGGGGGGGGRGRGGGGGPVNEHVAQPGGGTFAVPPGPQQPGAAFAHHAFGHDQQRSTPGPG